MGALDERVTGGLAAMVGGPRPAAQSSDPVVALSILSWRQDQQRENQKGGKGCILI